MKYSIFINYNTLYWLSKEDLCRQLWKVIVVIPFQLSLAIRTIQTVFHDPVFVEAS